MIVRQTIISDDDWPVEIVHLRTGFAGQLNVYRMMAHHPALLEAWTNLRNHLVLGSSLSRQQSEIIILRTGWQHRSRYEWAHHVSRGRQCGLSDQTIAACGDGTAAPDAEARLLIGAVDALLAQSHLPDGLRSALTRLFGIQGILDLMATVGMYTTLAFILETFEVPLDSAIAEELTGDPLLDLAAF